MGWGHIDVNGQVLETLSEERELVCLNNGRGTRVDVHTERESVLDLTLASNTLGDRGSSSYSSITPLLSTAPDMCLLELRKSERES